MTEIRLADGVVRQLLAREARYDERAYLFVLASIEQIQARLPVRRHLSGPEVAHGCREFARRQFGLLAPDVLRHWGVTETLDLGRIVYTLVDVGLLITQPGDRLEDFAGAYEFAQAFDEWTYVWDGVRQPDHGGGTSRREVS